MESKNTASVYKTLSAINVNEHVEVKDTGHVKLSYLSWAWAWAKVKENYPDAYYTIYENEKGWNYHTDGRTGWVKTGVTINGLEHIEYLPIMDNRNQSVAFESITSMDVNKAIQRSLTKAAARHGLGLYIYAGEDLPEEEMIKNKETSGVDLPKALEELKACKTADELTAVFTKWKKIHPDYCKVGHEFFNSYSDINAELAFS